MGNDWNIKGHDADQAYARADLSESALEAACRTTAQFDPAFPGWELYRMIVAGAKLHLPRLRDWAASTAKVLAASTRKDGRPYVVGGPGSWASIAGLDALHKVIYGRYPPGTTADRAKALGVSMAKYRSVRDPVAACMQIGLLTFQSQLTANYYRVVTESRIGA